MRIRAPPSFIFLWGARGTGDDSFTSSSKFGTWYIYSTLEQKMIVAWPATKIPPKAPIYHLPTSPYFGQIYFQQAKSDYDGTVKGKGIPAMYHLPAKFASTAAGNPGRY